MVLSMYGAHEVDQRTAPDLVQSRGRACRPRRPADAARVHDGRGAAQRVRHRPQSAERGGRRDHRPDAAAQPRGTRRRDRARARAHQEPRHAADDHHRDHRRRDLDGGAVRHVLRRQPRQQQRPRHHRLDRHDDPGAARRHAGADGDQPDARIRRRRSRRAHLRPADVAGVGAGQDRQRRASGPEPGSRAQSGDRAHVHHQPAVGPRHGQSVHDAPRDRKPHRRVAAARGADGRAGRRAFRRRPRQLSAPQPVGPASASRGPWG